MSTTSTAGITRGLAHMAVTTRSQAKGQPTPGLTGTRRSNRINPTSTQPTSTDEPMEDPQSPTGGGDEEDGSSGDSDDGDGNDPNDSGSSESDDDSDEDDTIRSKSTRITYDVSELSEEGRIRVDQGLNPGPRVDQMSMSFCEEYSTESYRFHINDTVTVILGKPGTNVEIPRCTCGMARDGVACKHVYWLEDQLLAALVPENSSFKLNLDGSQISGLPPTTPIERMSGLIPVANKRDWMVDGVRPSEQDVHEMLSVFEPIEPGSTSPKSPNYAQKFEEFGKVIVGQTFRDSSFGLRLRKIITPDFQARAFFDKMLKNVTRTFARLDEHVQTGATGSNPETDVRAFANDLRELVDKIGQGFEKHIKRGTRRPELIPSAEVGAGALIKVLGEVSSRNRNMYAERIELHPSRSSSPDDRTNLYQILVGTSDERPPQYPGLFVVDVLSNLLPEFFRNHVDSLEQVTSTIKEQGAPRAFISALEGLIPSRKRGAAESAGPNPYRTRYWEQV